MFKERFFINGVVDVTSATALEIAFKIAFVITEPIFPVVNIVPFESGNKKVLSAVNVLAGFIVPEYGPPSGGANACVLGISSTTITVVYGFKTNFVPPERPTYKCFDWVLTANSPSCKSGDWVVPLFNLITGFAIIKIQKINRY